MTDEIGSRWRAGVAWLRHATGQPPRLTLWGWVADGLVALVLTIGAIAGVVHQGDAAAIRVGNVVPLAVCPDEYANRPHHSLRIDRSLRLDQRLHDLGMPLRRRPVKRRLLTRASLVRRSATDQERVHILNTPFFGGEEQRR